MEDFNLFADIDVEPLEAHAPVGGISDEMFNSISWTRANLTRIGQPDMDGQKGWASKLKRATTSIPLFARRTERPHSEYLVSQKLNGEWRTGMSELDHAALVVELERQGYERRRKDYLAGFLVEHYVHRPELEGTKHE